MLLNVAECCRMIKLKCEIGLDQRGEMEDIGSQSRCLLSGHEQGTNFLGRLFLKTLHDSVIWQTSHV